VSVLARIRIELILFARQKDTVVFTFLLPIVMLVLFATVFHDRVQDGHGGSVPYPQYFLPGILAAGIGLVSFQTLAVGIAVERHDGTLKRLAATPLPPASYFLGKCVLVLVTAAAQVAVLLTVAALAFRVPLPARADAWLTFAWVFTIGTMAGALLGVAYAGVPRSAASAGVVVAGPVLLLQFVSGVYFNFPDLPRWLQTVAAVFPLKWIAQGMRSAFLPGSFAAAEPSGSWQHGAAAVVLGVWAVLGLALCLRTFRWTPPDGRSVSP